MKEEFTCGSNMGFSGRDHSFNVKFVKILNNVNVICTITKTFRMPMVGSTNCHPLSSISCEMNKSLELEVAIAII